MQSLKRPTTFTISILFQVIITFNFENLDHFLPKIKCDSRKVYANLSRDNFCLNLLSFEQDNFFMHRRRNADNSFDFFTLCSFLTPKSLKYYRCWKIFSGISKILWSNTSCCWFLVSMSILREILIYFNYYFVSDIIDYNPPLFIIP